MPMPPAGVYTLRDVLDISDGIPELPRLPRISRATLVGIVVAVSGNVVISLALNCQKLAHKRLEQRRTEAQSFSPSSAGDSETIAPRRGEHADGRDTPSASDDEGVGLTAPPTTALALVETQPLLGAVSAPRSADYGTGSTASISGPRHAKKKRKVLSRLFRFRKDDRRPYHDVDAAHLATTHALMPVDVISVPPGRAHNGRDHIRDTQVRTQETQDGGDGEEDQQGGNESDYLRSKLWWLGFLLMNLGELGNFVSYAFAPASVVAPLGTFALIANCIFAPFILKERFRKRDFLGIIMAIVGAITVVLSANPSDVRLNPEGLIHAIMQRAFIVYAAIYAAGAIILSYLSEGDSGKRWVYVDIGLCALFGGFTVLSTKAISTLLTLEWFEMFTEWITYPVIMVLVGTGIGQIKYLNRALMRFDSKIVVPTQFVLFNLSAIIGSAILYGDFADATFHQIVTFLYGCAATFAGVFVIAWAPSSSARSPDLENAVEEELQSVADDEVTGISSRTGSLSRSNRIKLVVPQGADAVPVIRPKHSAVSMYGLSPAQRVLLLSSSPRDDVVRPRSQDPEHQLSSTPESLRRRRTVSWLGDDAVSRNTQTTPSTPHGTREHSRLRAYSAATSRSTSHGRYS
ncbi:DUF803-domain-containing protein [Wolfiporia cocos MD-104 SS10]|uniref:DUF803-domain-containing protein n=1 Tax=Wolfiporia cocos (strain MD-104) TaxID=742152 RepID=A0A2H3JHH2_WOLCO|nr:DUF803-domain-containing protein [Wolfiporia cocos MD-104 SS10]